MTRRLLNLLSALSLLLCVAVAALWVRSHSAADGVTLDSGPYRIPDGCAFMPGVQLVSINGELRVRGHGWQQVDTEGWRPWLGGRVWISLGAANWVLNKPWVEDWIDFVLREAK